MVNENIFLKGERMIRIFPSIISADLLNLEKDITSLEPYCDGFHIDVMDAHFVPNLTIGPMVVNAIGTLTKKPLWVHLMVEYPADIIDALTLPPDSIITFHHENKADNELMIEYIRSKGWLPSMAINPKTPVTALLPYIDRLHQALIMSVEPGFSGQKFITDTIQKIAPLAIHKQTNNLEVRIAIDGGITQENIVMLKEEGIQDFAMASALFTVDDPVESLKQLRDKVA